jgi:hypothetical protein
MDGLSVEKVNICVLYQMNHKRHFEIVVIQIHIHIFFLFGIIHIHILYGFINLL